MATGFLVTMMVAGCEFPFHFGEGIGSDEEPAEDACTLGDRQDEYSDACESTWEECVHKDGVAVWEFQYKSNNSECDTPLAIELGGDTEWIPYEEVPGTFLFTTCDATDWPTHASPWLAMDLDHNGQIDDGTELFGNARGHANGFEALAALDDNQDGYVDLEDDAFADLLLWRDVDADRISQPDELSPLAEDGIVAIDLDYFDKSRCDARGNCVIERSVAYFADGSTAPIVDLYPVCRE